MFKHGEEVWIIPENLLEEPQKYVYDSEYDDRFSMIITEHGKKVRFVNDVLCYSYHQAIVAQAMLIDREIQWFNDKILRLEERHSELRKKFDSTKLTHDAEEFAKRALGI